MMRDYRLPDPPPELRDRILAETVRARLHEAGENPRGRLGPFLLLVGCLFLAAILVVVMFSSSNGPGEPKQGQATSVDRKPSLQGQDPVQEPEKPKPFDPFELPDTIQCNAALSQENPTQCTLTFTEIKGKRRQKRASLKVVTGKWAQLHYGNTISATRIVGGTDGEDPKVEEVEILESGIHIVAKTTESPEKGVTVTTTVFFFKDRAVARKYSYDADVPVGPGETRVYVLKASD